MMKTTKTTKTMKMAYGIALALTCSLPASLKAQNIYVADLGDGTIGEYGLDGSTVEAPLISGFPEGTAMGIAISGNDLFVANAYNSNINEYTTSGTAINAIFDSQEASAIAISGNDLFVANVENNTISEYTTSGTTVSASLITGLNEPLGLAISGNDLFVANSGNGTIGEYNLTTGQAINASLITGLNEPHGIAISGNDLFVANYGYYISEYTTSGTTVNASLVSGVWDAGGIAISGNDLFVTYCENNDLIEGAVAEYTLSGDVVNVDLISGLNDPFAIAISPPSAPVLSSPAFFNGQFQMAVSGSSNQTYTVQMATNLLSKNWVSLLVTNSPSGSFLFTDPNATNQQQFYRVEIAQ